MEPALRAATLRRYGRTVLQGGIAGAMFGLFYEVYKDVLEVAKINQYNRWLRMMEDLDRWREYFRWSQGWETIIYYDPEIFKGKELTRDDWAELMLSRRYQAEYKNGSIT